ncbi:MAG: DUF938 domain-containing protein [Pseudomonadota bacterium]
MNFLSLPHSEACERNKAPIAEALETHLSERARVLEVGAGTGQHGEYLAGRLTHLTWQMTDVPAALPGLNARQTLAALPNLPRPLPLDLAAPAPEFSADAVFSANVLHIVAWPLVENLFSAAYGWLAPAGQLLLYGPFNEDGFTSEGNRSLDRWARDSFPGGGLRELAAVKELAASQGFEDFERMNLPANNLLLRWSRNAAS